MLIYLEYSKNTLCSNHLSATPLQSCETDSSGGQAMFRFPLVPPRNRKCAWPSESSSEARNPSDTSFSLKHFCSEDAACNLLLNCTLTVSSSLIWFWTNLNCCTSPNISALLTSMSIRDNLWVALALQIRNWKENIKGTQTIKHEFTKRCIATLLREMKGVGLRQVGDWHFQIVRSKYVTSQVEQRIRRKHSLYPTKRNQRCKTSRGTNRTSTAQSWTSVRRRRVLGQEIFERGYWEKVAERSEEDQGDKRRRSNSLQQETRMRAAIEWGDGQWIWDLKRKFSTSLLVLVLKLLNTTATKIIHIETK